MAKKKLPGISVHGALQELIEIEMIFHFLGYHNEEEWDNAMCDREKDNGLLLSKFSNSAYLLGHELGRIGYHNHNGGGFRFEQFKAGEINEIIDYVLNYK